MSSSAALPPVPGHQLAGLPSEPRCLVMGVINVTPDSFSDGGDWLGPEDAIAHGLDLARALHAAQAGRSARKEGGGIRVELDPAEVV